MSEPSVHSFIIKLWFEQPSEEARDSATWHGHITHVPGGERAYLKDLEGATDFITSYLEAYGVKVSATRRFAHWLKRLRLSAMRSRPRL